MLQPTTLTVTPNRFKKSISEIKIKVVFKKMKKTYKTVQQPRMKAPSNTIDSDSLTAYRRA